MRLLFVLLFCTVFTVNASVYPQGGIVNLDLRDVSVSELFEEIKKQTDYSFFYNNQRIAGLKKVSVRKNNAPVEEVLEEVLNGTDLTWSLVEGVIVIREKGQNRNEAQSSVIEGTVTDAGTGEPIPGVTIMVKNSVLGRSTDFDGNFTIKLPVAEATLVFSYIGYETVELPVKGGDKVNVVMKEQALDLGEVVVTGYQVIDKRELTSSIASVEAEDLDIVGAISVDRMLEGKATGLNITNISSTPGAAAKIRIRGGSTFTGNQSPLWVIDGVIYEDPVPLSAADINSFDNVNVIGNALTGINPSDIAKIDILKDASATAIYGTRAANGVIVITTKRGKTGTPVLTYSGGYSIVQAPKYSDFNLMNSAERIDVSREMYERNLGFTTSYENIDRLGYEGALMNLWDGTYNYDEFQQQVNYLETLNTDWFDLLYDNAFLQSHAVSASGGGDNSRYYFSVGYDDQEGTEKNTGLNRVTARSNLDLDLRDNLKLSFRLSGSVQKAKYNHNSVSPFDVAYYTSRTIPAFDENGDYFQQSQLIMRSTTGENVYGGYNVLREIENSEQNITNKDLLAAANLRWDFLDNFRFTSQISYRNTTNLREEWITDETFYSANLRTYDAFEDLIERELDNRSSLPFGGVYNGGMVSQDTYSITNQLNYNQVFGGKHAFNLNLGQEARSIKYWGAQGFTVPGYNHYQGRGFIALPSPSFTTNDDDESILDYANYDYDAMMSWLTTDGGLDVYPNITDRVNNRMSWFGIFNYVYDGRYVLNFNARSDGSNTFGQYERYKFKPTWSASGRWNIHNESFLRNSEDINELSLRASYGLRGTMPNASPYLIISDYGRNSAVYYPEYTANLSEFPNANLRWEKTQTLNVGLNYSFFQGRISGAFDYAYSKSTDLLQGRPVSLVNGTAVQMFNSGSKDVSTYELALRTVNLQLEDLQWSTFINFSYDRDRVLAGFEEGAEWNLTAYDYLQGSIYRAGFPTSGFFSYQFDGLDENGLPTFKNLVEEDMSSEEQLEAMLVYEGSRVPLYYGGFGTQLRMGSFNLTANFTYKLGYKTRLLSLYNGNQNLPLPYENMHGDFNDRWRVAGDEENTNIPAISNLNLAFGSSESYAEDPGRRYVTNYGTVVPEGTNAWWMYDFSDARVVSADHIRLQTLTLSYNLPSNITQSLGLQNMNLSVQGSNLAYWAFDKDLRGQDPEQVSGIGVPSLPTYSMSVNMSF